MMTTIERKLKNDFMKEVKVMKEGLPQYIAFMRKKPTSMT